MEVSLSSRYRLIRRLGSGGMGDVLLAEDTVLGRNVAIKVMSPELAKDENQRKRFRMEARAASALSHPNICVVHDVGETSDGRPYLAMEYCEGETLEKILLNQRLRIRQTIEIGIQVAEALDAAHGRGLLHRDIKPGNITIDRRGRVKVLDFGLAKLVGDQELTASTSLHQTRTGVLLGSPQYMSPEQALGRELTPASDLFSLGAVLYEAVAGRKAFRGQTVGEAINNVINYQAEPLGLENPLFTPALDRIIFRCLEKDPQKRYASARGLADDLIKLKQEAERESVVAREVSSSPAPATTAPAATAPRSGKRPVIVPAAAAALLLVGLAVALFFSRSTRGPEAGSALAGGGVQQKSIAVLPFDNFSPDPGSDYLGDGLTDEITTVLSRVPGLKVVARNSGYNFKDQKTDLARIARELHVGTVLEGSIRKVGKQLRVTAKLVSAPDGVVLWSESYDRSVDDLIAVQEDIASRIAERLQGSPRRIVVRSKSVDPEAYKLYLQGRYAWNKRTEAGLKRAVQLFQQAIEREPTYAAAHAGLAASYLLMPLYSKWAKPNDYRPLARSAAAKALEFDPDSSEALTVLAQLEALGRDLKLAEEHFKRAIQLNPNYVTAHHWYGRFLNMRGQRDQGMAELKTAIELEPGSAILNATIPEWHYLGGDYDRAVKEGRLVVQKFPDFPVVRGLLIASLIKKGDYQLSLAEIDAVRKLQPEDPLSHLEMKAYALARMGQTDDARKILAEFEKEREQGKPVEGSIAFIYLGLREYDKAMDMLEHIAITDGIDEEIKMDPMMEELWPLPRFQALMEKLSKKQGSPA